MSILPIFIPHAGCPHQCVFCNQKAISGQKTAALEGARQQISRWLQWIKPDKSNEAAFYGGSFTGLQLLLQEQLLQLSDNLIEKGIIGSVRLSTRPDYITGDVLELLKKHSVTLVELGVQSLDDAVLAKAERGHTALQVQQAVTLLKEYGFAVGLQLMVGMPGQSFASVKETALQAAALAPDVARIYPLLVIKDTPLAKAFQSGIFAPLSLEEAVEQSAYIYETLTAAGVQVIRIGLQPDDELCAPGNILAGPFHPAMGELVKSRAVRRQLTPQLEQISLYSNTVRISFAPAMESKLRGHKNCNLRYWQKKWPQLHIVLESNATLKNEEICICRNVNLSRR